MKILFVDIILDGHHRAYLDALISKAHYEAILALPERIENLECRQYLFSPIDFFHKKLKDYLNWLNEISTIADTESPDIIHFLYGDVFYKFFGLGLNQINKKYKTIITLHGKRNGKLYGYSIKAIFQQICMGVVHTDVIWKELKSAGIKNVYHIEYPCFASYENLNRESARIKMGLLPKGKVLGCLGSTRYDKGLDFLLESLKNVSADYEVIIAGKPEAWNEAHIKELAGDSWPYIHLLLKYLTDEEFQTALIACDIIVLPYRRSFNGASGPLTEGIWNNKVIIGPNHGSLGAMIKENHLGYTFESENIHSLAETIENALNSEFEYDNVALQYKASLSVEYFKHKYTELYHKK
ncbi:glycosyltransferase [Lachnospiraceae bacterium 62-35]